MIFAQLCSAVRPREIELQEYEISQQLTREASSMEGQSTKLSGSELKSSSGSMDKSRLMKEQSELLDGETRTRIRIPFSFERKIGLYRNLIIESNLRPMVLLRALTGKAFFDGLTYVEFYALDSLLQRLWKEFKYKEQLEFTILLLHAIGTKSKEPDQPKRSDDPYSKDRVLLERLVNQKYVQGFALTSKLKNFLKSMRVESPEDLISSKFSPWKIPTRKHFGGPLVKGVISVTRPIKPKSKTFIGKGYTDHGRLFDPSKDDPFVIINGEESSTSYDDLVQQTLNSF